MSTNKKKTTLAELSKTSGSLKSVFFRKTNKQDDDPTPEWSDANHLETATSDATKVKSIGTTKSKNIHLTEAYIRGDETDVEVAIDNPTSQDDTVDAGLNAGSGLVRIELQKVVEYKGKYYRGVQEVTSELAAVLLELDRSIVTK